MDTLVPRAMGGFLCPPRGAIHCPDPATVTLSSSLLGRRHCPFCFLVASATAGRVICSETRLVSAGCAPIKPESAVTCCHLCPESKRPLVKGKGPARRQSPHRHNLGKPDLGLAVGRAPPPASKGPAGLIVGTWVWPKGLEGKLSLAATFSRLASSPAGPRKGVGQRAGWDQESRPHQCGRSLQSLELPSCGNQAQGQIPGDCAVGRGGLDPGRLHRTAQQDKWDS